MYLTSSITLFFTAFLGATLLPSSSEALLVVLLSKKPELFIHFFIISTLGNTLGSCVNWWLGTQLEHYKYKKWFPIPPQQLAKAQKIFQRYGYASLLFSWLPIIGDPLTMIAGIMKTPFRWFFTIVLIAKASRYIVVITIFFYIYP